MPLANLGPVASPGFLLALWVLCAGIEALVCDLGLRRAGLPRRRVRELALLLNLISWPLFLAALKGMWALGLAKDVAFVVGEVAVVLAEAWGLGALLRQGLPAEDRGRVPRDLSLLPVSLAANLASIGVGLIVSLFL
ncbi:MAG: hypothetical protein R3F30_01345 [Planctomycetota bacterium]